MWLRDYLPKDIQNQARVLIYGYDSQLNGVHAAKSIILDFSKTFIQSLMDIRYHASCRDRPLILIGHSFGGLIIKQAIASLSPKVRSCLPIRTVLFFGVPHNGLEVTALETLVKGFPTHSLISDLKRESYLLANLSENFRHASKDLSIHTYYESRPTATVVQRPDGEWERSGPRKVMVERSSAVLNTDQEETQYPVHGDHKEIVRLKFGQGGAYPNVKHVIREALQSASMQFAVAAAQLAEDNPPSVIAPDEDDAGTEDQEQKPEDNDDENEDDESEDDDDEYDDDEYDDENLICDTCFNEFPKNEIHHHCYICDDGNFNICQSCNKSGETCPGGHEMLERQLGNPEPSNDGNKSENESENDENTLWCDSCNDVFQKDQVHFHCIYCDDGTFDLCLSCRKMGKICPGRHKMLKRQLPINTPAKSPSAKEKSPSPEVSSETPQSLEENSSPTERCDDPTCSCALPTRAKTTMAP